MISGYSFEKYIMQSYFLVTKLTELKNLEFLDLKLLLQHVLITFQYLSELN
jgi:hypothetical protein